MKWVVALIAVEAVVEILVHSPLFGWLRRLAPQSLVYIEKYNYMKIQNDHSHPLFECGWCLSVWIAAMAFGLIVIGLWWIMIPLAIARMSNVFHEIFMRLRG
jgi:hypothetical protein